MPDFIGQKIKLAVDKAEKILSDQKIVKVPVDIESIAKSMGIDVTKIEFSKDEISGAIKMKGKQGNPIIAINQNHCIERQRFTIAHEIGHFVLHSIDNMHIDSAGVYFRDSNASSSTTNLKEAQANQFAAEILMPRGLVIKDLQGDFKLKNNNEDIMTIAKLAKKYNVSQQAMMIRIGGLVI
ncbi:MAG: ImmA/IrrE family metallo-endopeptidase [Patescibacteria group bacterium]|nr:ImmA/IrrE family metallo-endopeptidase [Patescibacteria group bacterium]